MTDVLIKRELLERLEHVTRNLVPHLQCHTDLVAALAAPRQPEGEVQPEWVTIEIQRNTINYLNRDIAELREECEHWKSGANAEAARADELKAERDTLRQQLADSDAALRESRANDQAAMAHLADMRQQRDKLAGLLADVKADYTHAIHWEDLHATMKRIEAALAEVNK